MTRLLLKLEDFRLLPFLVLVSMAVGILIGNALSISDFALTPPIDALKSIAAGTFEPSVLAHGVKPLAVAGGGLVAATESTEARR